MPRFASFELILAGAEYIAEIQRIYGWVALWTKMLNVGIFIAQLAFTVAAEPPLLGQQRFLDRVFDPLRHIGVFSLPVFVAFAYPFNQALRCPSLMNVLHLSISSFRLISTFALINSGSVPMRACSF